MKSRAAAVWIAWLLAAVYYLYQYALRSAPAVMLPQLSEAFHLNAAAMASVLGLFYYAYAALSLVAGISIDRIGARTVIPAGALLTGVRRLTVWNGKFHRGQRRQIPPGRRRCIRPDWRHLHCRQEFPRFSSRNLDWRHSDVSGWPGERRVSS